MRHNVISACEQTGICGSLGAVYSEITDNHIFNIWAKRQFAGAEMGGIKLHAAIDVLIARNRIHNTGRGMWMDWMAQGTRISRNLCYDNTTEDLYMEVDHGPYLVDNNLFLSPRNLWDMSQGGAYAHNLFAGLLDTAQELKRITPYHPAHATTVVARWNIPDGDNRWFNNVFIGAGTEPPPADPKTGNARQRYTGYGPWVYDTREHPSFAGGNVYYRNARPYAKESSPLLLPQTDPQVKLADEGDHVFLQTHFATEVAKAATPHVTTALLGRARVPNLPFENPDGSPLTIETDYFGQKRDAAHPAAGPFAQPAAGAQKTKVW